MRQSINITINNQVVTAVPGDTVYRAAQRAGIAIPSLCVSEHLAPFGSCRLCICEVEGQAGTPAACIAVVREGMIVRTDTERLTRHRRNIVELYLSEGPDKGEPPEAIREMAGAVGLTRVRYRETARRAPVSDESNPFFAFDNAACISCARCVRACDEIQGTHALTMLGPGLEARPKAGWSEFVAS